MKSWNYEMNRNRLFSKYAKFFEQDNVRNVSFSENFAYVLNE